jgi:hypothetical protein
VAAVNDEASFTFSWLALKLLGRGLYSNPWSALSELVANGFDAGATDVYVYVDARDKSMATVEVIDNGSGMSRSDIETYVKVGYDKRKAESNSDLADARPKGRKGIGKLAALFLSSHFYLSTRHAEGSSSWELDAREGKVDDDEKPRLMAVGQGPSTPNDSLWDGLASGTRLTMLGVDLTGYGAQAVSALGTRLANQFLLPVSSTPRVLLWVQATGAQSEPAYEPVVKSIAFGNLSDVVMNFPNSAIQPLELAAPLQDVKIPAKGLPGESYTHTPTRSAMIVEPEQDDAWAEVADDVDTAKRTYRDVPFALTGWIGVHATIDNEPAQANDERFTKNRYYNPAQIRVYVRGKLASDRLLSQLGLTGTYANYIEGEITFDLLDDDSLPDIATSNRQDFDETDKRVTLLRALVRPRVRALIQGRNNLASTIAAEVRKEKERRETASKRHFSEQVRADLDQHDDIPQPTRDELEMVITNKIQGDVTPKQSFRVFISHARPDGAFAAFIDELLRARGAKPEEIFFTSRTGSTDVLLDVRALSDVVKRNITDDNTLIFYMTSKNFLASQFCLFEGGAGWATRAVSEYLKLNVEYSSIPGWLTNGRGEAVLLGPDNAIELTAEVHNYLIDGILNPMIEHLNRGRDIAGEAPIALFVRTEFPSAVEMSRDGKAPQDYFDAVIVEHWAASVQGELATYLAKYFEPSDEAKRIAELEIEIAQLRAIVENENIS